jgi:hypothetical protein
MTSADTTSAETTRALPYAPDSRLVCTEVGRALLLHRPGPVDASARRLAVGVAADPEHTVVVLDLPPDVAPPVRDAAARLLGPRPGGFRLVFTGAGPAGAATAAAQWLADRLRRTVITHDGAVVPVGEAGLFVPSGAGSGWVRFRPGARPQHESHRFPRPAWDPLPVTTQARAGSSMVEPLPGGLWIRRVHPDPGPAPHRDTLVTALVVQHEVLTVVLGSPGAPPLSLDDVAMVWRELPPATRAATRFVEFGPVGCPADTSPGAALAELLGEPVTFYTGLPAVPPADGAPGTPGPVPRTVRADGRPGWHPYAGQLRFAPGTDGALPGIVAHRRPVPEAPEIAPGRYAVAPDAVLEVIAAGLWVRAPEDLSDPAGAGVDGAAADAVRRTPLRPDRFAVVYEARTPEVARRLHRVAVDTVKRLEPSVRRFSEVRAVGLPAGASAAPDPVAVLDPVVRGPLAEAPARPAAGLRPAGLRLETAEPDLAAAPAASSAQVPSVTAASSTALSSTALSSTALSRPAPSRPVAPSPAPPIPGPPVAAPALARPGAGPLPAAAAVAGGPTAGAPGVGTPATGPRYAAPSPAVPPARAPSPPAPSSPAPSRPAPDPARPTPASSEPRPAPHAARPAPRVQPVPAADASALVPATGIAEERRWLRRTFSAEHDAESGVVAALLSQVPGLRAGADPADVVLDLLGVRLYLRGGRRTLADAVRAAQPGPHVPLARCVAAGLRRLPSFRGPARLVVPGGAALAGLYRQHPVLTEWAFVDAPPAGAPSRPGDLEVRIWSSSARRTALLDGVAERVVFGPGTGFRVLAVTDDAPAPVVLLRELPDGADGGEPSPFDDIARAGLDRAAEQWPAPGSGGAGDPGAGDPRDDASAPGVLWPWVRA